MNTKNLIESVKFQVSVKPQDEFMAEVAEGLETLHEENNRQKAEIERLERHELKEAMTFNNDTIKKAADESVKEFDERLSREISKIPQHHFSLLAVQAVIEKVKKEMVGEG